LGLKILEKLRTASLSSEFTGSYKKVYHWSKQKIAYPSQILSCPCPPKKCFPAGYVLGAD